MFYKPEMVLMVFWQLNHQDHSVARVNDMKLELFSDEVVSTYLLPLHSVPGVVDLQRVRAQALRDAWPPIFNMPTKETIVKRQRSEKKQRRERLRNVPKSLA